MKYYTIKQIADMAGITVRTLHHYDHVKLLCPDGKGANGYRIYTSTQLQKLRQILFFKELGFTLAQIKEILDSENFDRRKALQIHKELLLNKRQRLDELINNVDRNIKALEGGLEMNEEEMFSPFEDKKIREYTQQAREKYSNSLVEQSIEKVSAYSKKEWEDIMEYGDSLMKEMKGLMNMDPADKTVQNVISKHYQMINDNFYDCSIEIYSGLADLYISDERFTAFFEKYAQGLAKYMHDAIKIFCSEKR